MIDGSAIHTSYAKKENHKYPKAEKQYIPYIDEKMSVVNNDSILNMEYLVYRSIHYI